MAVPTLVELAESGAHFGHHRSLTFPKSKDNVFMVKDNVAIINLVRTQEALANAQQVFKKYLDEKKPILFVGTRRAIRGITKEIAESVGCSYITERWFGGMLTNFSTIIENIKRMNEEIEYLASDQSKHLSKKERLMHENKLARSRRFLGGVSTLKEMPALIILTSASEDKIAIEEANQVGVPIISVIDTDMNPELITYPIPANDDAPKAVELILRTIVAAPEEPAPVVVEPSAETPTAELAPKTKKTAAKKAVPTKKVTAKKTVAKKPAKKAAKNATAKAK